MVSKLIVLCVALCAIQIGWAAEHLERAPVTDEKLKQQGYACQGKTVAPMKNGEENNNYDPKKCERVACSSGILTYASCPTMHVEGGGKLIPGDLSKPYPECCSHP